MKKILYAAGTMAHINCFHLDCINRLRQDGNTVLTMANGEGADFNIPFQKKMFSLKNLRNIGKIRSIIKREKFDTVILNTTLAAFFIRLALGKKKRPKVINIVHGYMFSERPRGKKEKIFHLAERFVAGKTDYALVMNQADFNSAGIYRYAINDAIKIDGMGAFVSPDKSNRKEIRQSLSCEDKFVMSFAGEICDNKNQSFLINALKEIKASLPGAVLWLLGKGDKSEEYKKLAADLGLSDSVFFLGYRDNPCDFIRASELYVSASKKEGLPFNIIEALGCKKTVLASDIKGQNDIIEDGVSGFLYESGNLREFVEKVLDFANGRIALDEEKMYERYKIYSKEQAFLKTYGVIKEIL